MDNASAFQPSSHTPTLSHTTKLRAHVSFAQMRSKSSPPLISSVTR